MALWYFSRKETSPDQICQTASSPADFGPLLSSSCAARATDAIAQQILALADAGDCYRVSVDVRTKNLFVFTATVSERNTRLELRIEGLRKTGRIASTFRHTGRPVDPRTPFFTQSIAHFRTGNAQLFQWIELLLEAGKIDYRAQSPKIRVGEEKQWGHPFPFTSEDLTRVRSEFDEVLQKAAGTMAGEWDALEASRKANRVREQERLKIMNALPDGAFIAVTESDRMYGSLSVKIGRKQGSFGPKAAQHTRLLNEHDLTLMKRSRDFAISRHDELRMIAEIRDLHAKHPDAGSFDLRYAALRRGRSDEIHLHRSPCLPSFNGSALPSPQSKQGTLEYSWVQGGPGPQHQKPFEPRAPQCWPAEIGKIVLSNSQGKGLPVSALPRELQHAPKPNDPPLRLNHALHVNGLWIVSPALRSILTQHEIGKTTFLPVTLFDIEGTPLNKMPWSYVSFREEQGRFDATTNRIALGLRRQASPPYRISAYEHDIACLSPATKPGLDLWVDPHVPDCFFTSGRLTLAIRAARMGIRLGLKRCIPSPE